MKLDQFAVMLDPQGLAVVQRLPALNLQLLPQSLDRIFQLQAFGVARRQGLLDTLGLADPLAFHGVPQGLDGGLELNDLLIGQDDRRLNALPARRSALFPRPSRNT